MPILNITIVILYDLSSVNITDIYFSAFEIIKNLCLEYWYISQYFQFKELSVLNAVT